jgi:hypothetical protein
MGVILVTGIPGTGKNTFATQLIKKNLKRGHSCFSTYPVKTKAFFFYTITCNSLNPEDLKKYIFPEGSILVIDEAHLNFNSRDSLDKKTSNMTKEIREFLTYVRHLDNDVYILCQMAGSVDKLFREYAEQIIFLKFFRPMFLFKDIFPLRWKYTFYSAKDFDAPDWEELRVKGLLSRRIYKLSRSTWKDYNSRYGLDLMQKSRQYILTNRYENFNDTHIITLKEKIWKSLKSRYDLFLKLKRGEF